MWFGADEICTGCKPEQSILPKVICHPGLFDLQRPLPVTVRRLERGYCCISNRFSSQIEDATENRAGRNKGQTNIGRLLARADCNQSRILASHVTCARCRQVVAPGWNVWKCELTIAARYRAVIRSSF